jgi:putative lipoic acid-binding regulatory protein
MGMNYTEEVTTFLVEKYTENPCMETVVLLAEKYDKTVKSIIGKLSREGVYRGVSVHVIAKKYSCEPIDIMRILGIWE